MYVPCKYTVLDHHLLANRLPVYKFGTRNQLKSNIRVNRKNYDLALQKVVTQIRFISKPLIAEEMLNSKVELVINLNNQQIDLSFLMGVDESSKTKIRVPIGTTLHCMFNQLFCGLKSCFFLGLIIVVTAIRKS